VEAKVLQVPRELLGHSDVTGNNAFLRTWVMTGTVDWSRNVYSRKHQTTQDCVSSGMAIFVYITAMDAAGDGISPSMVQSAQLQQPLMVLSTWYREVAAEKIYTVCGKLKESVRKSKRALCAWDSGSAIVLVMDLLMLKLAGTQCPGSTWKKYLLHRLDRTDRDFVFCFFNC